MAGLMRTPEQSWREKWDEGERKRIACDGERRYKLGEDVIEKRDRGYTNITSEDQFARNEGIGKSWMLRVSTGVEYVTVCRG